MTARARSFWAWGYEDRFPDGDARKVIAGHVRGLLGVEALPAAAEVMPRIDAARLPEPRLEVPAALEGVVSRDREERLRHTYGRAYRDLVRGFRGDFTSAPDLVARPSSEEEVERVLAYCAAEGVAAIPYGGGTSVVGGVEPVVGRGFRGALSLDLGRLDRVLEVDPISRAARIQAGALGPSLEAQLAAHGLTLRHYPQSFEHSTLGGWLATRAGGHFATQRTRIDDFVESLRMITPRGVFETRRLPGSGAGPQPERLVLGSEGTLGVITEAWMRVLPRPKFRARANVAFPTFAEAAQAARAIVQAGLTPANARVLDPAEAVLAGVFAEGRAVLLLAFESDDAPLEPDLARALKLAGGVVVDGPAVKAYASGDAAGAAERWRDAFFAAPYYQSALVSLGVIADTFETACTWSRFGALVEAVDATVREAMRRVAGAGYLGVRLTHVYPDGPAPYFTFLAPAKPGAELEQWAEIKAAASDALAAHGGTITHHHAVGRMHRPWYDRERPDLFAAALGAAKGALDPRGVMNPGVLLDAETNAAARKPL